jgi:hypothetical protein
MISASPASVNGQIRERPPRPAKQVAQHAGERSEGGIRPVADFVVDFIEQPHLQSPAEGVEQASGSAPHRTGTAMRRLRSLLQDVPGN